MGNQGLDISVDELRKQHTQAVEIIAKQREEIDLLKGEWATAKADAETLYEDMNKIVPKLERDRITCLELLKRLESGGFSCEGGRLQEHMSFCELMNILKGYKK